MYVRRWSEYFSPGVCQAAAGKTVNEAELFPGRGAPEAVLGNITNITEREDTGESSARDSRWYVYKYNDSDVCCSRLTKTVACSAWTGALFSSPTINRRVPENLPSWSQSQTVRVGKARAAGAAHSEGQDVCQIIARPKSEPVWCLSATHNLRRI